MPSSPTPQSHCINHVFKISLYLRIFWHLNILTGGEQTALLGVSQLLEMAKEHAFHIQTKQSESKPPSNFLSFPPHRPVFLLPYVTPVPGARQLEITHVAQSPQDYSHSPAPSIHPTLSPFPGKPQQSAALARHSLLLQPPAS